MNRVAAVCAALLMLAACGGEPQVSPPVEAASAAASSEMKIALDPLAERFVKLALAAGQHDPAFVDAYHGPAEWAEAAKASPASLEELEGEAEALLAALEEADAGPRAAMLRKLALAALTRIRMVSGETYAFDEETRALYDAVAPAYDIAEFDAALAEIEALTPGEGALSARVDAFRNSFAIPPDRLQTVFDAAIAECRRRTAERFDLPQTERFRLEFVSDKPWSGYNWYQGDFESLIQVNTDLPIVIDRALDLGCHEGYPGHHVWNMVIEGEFLKKNGWIEYSVYPLFSPLSLIAEGSANYGIALAFPNDEKMAFERDVLFPLAGLDPARAESLTALNRLRRKLSHADNYVAREYLEGRIGKDAAIQLLMRYGLYERERAEQRLRFIETYRGYVINYNLGRDLVEAHVDAKSAGTGDRWAAFKGLLASPVTASDIAVR